MANPTKTKNLFGSISEVAGQNLQVIERDETGDCLCVFNGKAGTNLVDVDHEDVENFSPAPSISDFDVLMRLLAKASKS